MRRKFEALRESLDEFVQQDEYPVLLVGCLSEELAYVVKFLQALEEKHPHCYFVVFPSPFDGPAEYLDGVVENVRAQVAGANELRPQRGEPPFPAVPEELSDRRRAPEERLRGVLDYLRELLPPPADDEEHLVVVGFLPLSCSDYAGYCGLMNALATSPALQPSLDRTRVVIYDDRSRSELVRSLRARQVDHVLTFEIDLSTPALTDQLTRDASDPTLPLPERMGALLQLAALDYSYRRYPDALEKYGVLYKFYEGQGLPAMQALCLLGVGDTLFAAEHPEPAKERLQQGIALAMAEKALPVLLNLFNSIHGVCMALKQYDEAESYAGSGIEVAAAVLQPFAYMDFHEQQGDAQLAQGKLAEGLVTYRKCKELCEKYQYFHRWKSVLGKEKQLYESAQMRRERREVETQLAVVEELERRGGRTADAAGAAGGGATP
jgi:tetratricopeptide (TPR) repeat protein